MKAWSRMKNRMGGPTDCAEHLHSVNPGQSAQGEPPTALAGKRRRSWAMVLLALTVGVAQMSFSVAPAQGAPAPRTTTKPALATGAGNPISVTNAAGDVAATPPMGWNDWYTFHCNVNETLVKQTADAMVSSGMRDAGYKYVNIDDCWAAPTRDAAGNMQADPVKFPSGMKALAAYVHARGLKLGIYTDVGPKTCAGYVAGYGHEKRDVDTFAIWDIDFVKIDWCNVPFSDFPGLTQQQLGAELYGRWAKAFGEADRKMFFSICVWNPSVKSWEFASKIANSWRTSGDYGDTWDLIMRNGDDVAKLADFAHPGGWNDPDILMVGLGALTDTEYRTHFSIWSMAAAPLLAGNDLRNMDAATLKILTNREVIAVDQDSLGSAGRKLRSTANEDVWVRTLANGDTAVLLVNRSSTERLVSTNATELALPKLSRYSVRDLWTHQTTSSAGNFSAYLPAHGSAMVRISNTKQEPTAPSVVWGTTAAANVVGLKTPLVEAGKPVQVSGVALNNGPMSIENASVALTTPTGWTVSPASTQLLGVLKRDGGQQTPSWTVTPPNTSMPGSYDLTSTLTFVVDGVTSTREFTSTLTIPARPPAGATQLSDVAWMEQANGYGPPLKDKNYYGNKLSIGGQVYDKGLWTNAVASIGYYLGGTCTHFETDIGIDDSKGNNGSVIFQIYADDAMVYQSPVLHGADPVVHASVDLSGARSMRIAVTDAGDGITNDNADWGNPTLTCN